MSPAVVTGSRALGGRSSAPAAGAVLPTDVSDPDAVEAAARRRVEEAFGPIDIWVNDAMMTVFAFFGTSTPEEFRRATDVTYLGTSGAPRPR